MGHADGVGQLDLALVSQSRRHDVLGHIAGGVGRGAVHLGAVLAGECAAAVTGVAAVTVHDDLSTGQTAVTLGASDHKTTSGIDEELGILVHHVGGDNLIEHIPFDIRVNLLLGHILIVLGGKNNCVQADRFVVLVVLHGNLSLSVRAEVIQGAVLADLGQASGQPVGHRNRVGHILLSLIGGKAEHHALIACADGIELFLAHVGLSGLLGFQSLVHAQSDILGLLVNGGDYAAGIAVKTVFRAVIADLPHRLTDNLLNVHISAGGDLAHHQNQSGGGGGLAGHAAHGILL